MEKYFKRAIETGEELKIVTKNNKTLTVKIMKHDDYKVYYRLKNRLDTSSIKKENVKEVKFWDKELQKQFEREQSKYFTSIAQFHAYYCDYLKKIDGKNEIKEQLFDEMFQRLYSCEKDNLLLRYFLGIEEIEKKDLLNHICLLLDKSNISQRIAIQNDLNYDVSIIEGPPGTGKTTTILSIIANLIQQDKKVVVVSKNNSAVDNIIEEYGKIGLPEFYLRFGNKTIMTKLQEDFPSKLEKLDYELANLIIHNESLEKLKRLKQELDILETDINHLIELKGLITELKTQKKFIDRRDLVYQFKEQLREEETKILYKKHANIRTLNLLIKLANKNHYNFFERFITRYVLCLKTEPLNRKIVALKCLLEQLYINKELADKEQELMRGKLEEKQERVKAIYQEYTSLSLNAFKNDLKEKIKVTKKREYSKTELIQEAFQIYPLILTTADGFLFNFKHILKTQAKIDCVIIDEASQCDITTALPLLFLAKKIIVVGDSKQLSAIINGDLETKIPAVYKNDGNNFLNSIKWVFNPPTRILFEHYRCDYNIINFCNKYYYDNALKIYTDSHDDAIAIIDADKYKGAELDGDSFINHREIKTIEVMQKDMEHTFVITPFSGQAKLLKEKFSKDCCGTIHTFQGKGEKNVYFSAVLNDLSFCKKHIMGSHNLFYKELINVAVSRAKNKFVLVCDKKFFMNHAKYVPDVKNLIEYIGVYGQNIEDNSHCIFDNLYQYIPYYQSSRYFDNIYEEALFYQIKNVIQNKHYRCYPKLELVDMVQDKEFLNEYPEIFEYILNGAHADFSIMDTRINKVVLVIELDGESHKLIEQQKRDEYKKIALEHSNISLGVS